MTITLAQLKIVQKYSMPAGTYWAFSSGQSGVGYYVLCRVEKFIPQKNNMFAVYRDTNSSCSLSPRTGYQSYNNSDVSLGSMSNVVDHMNESASQCPFPDLPDKGVGSSVAPSGFVTVGHCILPNFVNTSKFNSMLRAFDTALGPDEDTWKDYIQYEPSKNVYDINSIHLNDFMEHKDPYYKDEFHELQYSRLPIDSKQTKEDRQ